MTYVLLCVVAAALAALSPLATLIGLRISWLDRRVFRK